MTWVDNALFEWQVTVDRWVALGTREEHEARLLARQAVPGLFEEVVDLLTKNPELRALVLRESTSLTNSAVQEVRERVGTADALVERLVHGIMRRSPERDAPSSALPAPHPTEGGPTQLGGSHDAG
jgi:hypothetical protein